MVLEQGNSGDGPVEQGTVALRGIQEFRDLAQESNTQVYTLQTYILH
jgi:hypothetical protein